MKGIEDLPRRTKVTINLQAPLSPSKNTDKKPSASSSNVYESLDAPLPKTKYAPRLPVTGQNAVVKEENTEEIKKIHWSQVEPFQQQQEKKGLRIM